MLGGEEEEEGSAGISGESDHHVVLQTSESSDCLSKRARYVLGRVVDLFMSASAPGASTTAAVAGAFRFAHTTHVDGVSLALVVSLSVSQFR